LPPRLATLLTDAERFPAIENDVGAVKRLVESYVRPASAGAV
jgi:hypothetical protein